MKKLTRSRTTRLWQVAVHEAGHALAHWLLGFRIKRVSIIPEGVSLGHVQGHREPQAAYDFIESVGIFSNRATAAREARWHEQIVTLLAGMAAERILTPKRNVTAGGSSDLESANAILLRLHPDNEQSLVFKWLQIRAANLVSRPVHRKMIKDLAEALMCVRVMHGRDAGAVLRWSFDRHTLKADSSINVNPLPACLTWTETAGFAKPTLP